MSNTNPLPFRAAPDQYQKQADALFSALVSADEEVAWRFKWEHPRFRGKPVADVKSAAKAGTLTLADAQTVVAREYSFVNWGDLAAFSKAVQNEGPILTFEAAVEAVISGNA